jgi:phosphate transport system permease protein
MKKIKENLSGHIFFVLALSSITALVVITVFIVMQGAPLLPRVFSTTWAPGQGEFGIIPMILGSIAVTLGAAVIGVPFGICCAIFMAELAPERMQKIFRPTIQLLAGIPSVVYGFWGMVFIVPFIRNYLDGPGLSVLAGSIVLSIMTLPTIISISEVSIIALPRTYKEGALALGMTHWQTIRSVQLPAAKSGIVAAVILGLGRAVGETMAVIMVMGNAPAIPSSIFEPARSLTAHIGIEMGYAGGEHRQALFATGIVLFVVIMCLNVTAQYLTRNKLKKS